MKTDIHNILLNDLDGINNFYFNGKSNKEYLTRINIEEISAMFSMNERDVIKELQDNENYWSLCDRFFKQRRPANIIHLINMAFR